MPNFEYALLALFIFGLVMNAGVLLFAASPKYVSAIERQKTSGIALAIDITLIVCCLLYY